jgi:hypothetical protein
MDYSKYKNKVEYYAPYPYTNDAYWAEERRLTALFWSDAFTELGIPADHPKADRMKSAAWEKGHANGHSEVFYELSDLWEVVKD